MNSLKTPLKRDDRNPQRQLKFSTVINAL